MNQYNPDTVSPPGETLRESIEHRGIKSDEFAHATRIDESIIEAIFAGKAEITREHAEKFEHILGMAADFWMRRQRDYSDFLNRK